MKNLIVFFILIFLPYNLFARVQSPYVGLPPTVCEKQLLSDGHTAQVFFFNAHTYICFDDKVWIHNPDCRCTARWYGSIENPDKSTSKIYLNCPPTHGYEE